MESPANCNALPAQLQIVHRSGQSTYFIPSFCCYGASEAEICQAIERIAPAVANTNTRKLFRQQYLEMACPLNSNFEQNTKKNCSRA
jgi:hypothetical protein